jgi:hypothetical protein
MYITEPVALTLIAQLTFKNGQTFQEQLNGFTPAMLEAKVDEYCNNDQLKSFKVIDETGKVVA